MTFPLNRFFIILLMVTAFSLTACSERETNESKMMKRAGIAYQKGSDTPYTGAVVGYYDNGQMSSRYSYKNGERHGAAKNWYPNGQIETESAFKAGVSIDRITKWYANGNKKIDITVVNGLAEGVMIEWYENGNKATETDYVGGRMNGTRTQWHENGELFQTYKVLPAP